MQYELKKDRWVHENQIGKGEAIRRLAADSNKLLTYITALSLALCLSLSACGGTVATGGEKFTELAVAAIGMKVPEKIDTPRLARPVALRIETAKDLNAGKDGQGLPTVARIYKLRDHSTFMAMPYASFMSPEKEKQALGGDLLEVRELTLLPGKTIDVREKMPGEATYLGVVAMFHNPFPRRWRFTFSTASLEGSGITIGAHTCALTATRLAPVGMTLDESSLLSSVRCK